MSAARRSLVAFSLTVLVGGCATTTGSESTPKTSGEASAEEPPTAERRPHQLESHGHTRIDPWYWLRDREDPQVRAYLEAENTWADRVLAPVAQLRQQIYDEIVGRIPPQDDSVPARQGDFDYWTRYLDGADYPHWVRRPAAGGEIEVVLDGPSFDTGSYLSIGSVEPDPSGRIAGFAIDQLGRRVYTLRFRDLGSGELLPDEIPGATGNFVWANDGSILYTTRDPITLRANRVLRHQLGDDPSADTVIATEDDATFSLEVQRSRSGKFLFIVAEHTLTTEWSLLDADHPERAPLVLMPRERGHEYDVEHSGEALWIRTNDQARDFRLMKAPIGPLSRDTWEEVIPARDDVLLDRVEGFRDFLVLVERHAGQRRVRVVPHLGEPWLVELEPEAQMVWIGENHQWAPDRLRLVFSGLITPVSTIDYHLAERRIELLKQEVVVGGFDSTLYQTERILVSADDGALVPVSLVRRRDLPAGPAPLLLYGYGAYGVSLDPSFNSARLSLLDRGFVYAIAHVRGGEELGRAWYEHGRLEHKQNTFSDFIDVAEALIARGLTAPDKLFAEGRSAGGLLVGAVVTQRPELFRGAIAGVPFVDVVTTMLDESIPLTTFEYDEWGDPREVEAYHQMLAYSPYDNVRAQRYPALLVTTGLHDSQVQYWEPAKWVAKLRATKTGDDPLLFVTDLDAGHGGAAGRKRRHLDTALSYAFLVGLVEGKI